MSRWRSPKIKLALFLGIVLLAYPLLSHNHCPVPRSCEVGDDFACGHPGEQPAGLRAALPQHVCLACVLASTTRFQPVAAPPVPSHLTLLGVLNLPETHGTLPVTYFPHSSRAPPV
jgi:hypothetical protein